MTDRPFAVHVTWTTYGSWLPGDPRGHVSNTRLPRGGFVRKQNIIGTPSSPADEFTHERARELQSHPTVFLTRDQAAVVARALVAAAATETRNWRIPRAAVMDNHVHVVVTDCPDDGPAVRRVLKGVTQAALSRHNGSPRRWWTENGSNRYKHSHEEIETAISYDASQPGMLAGVDDMRPFVVEVDGSIRYLDG
jgi:REP element-mobilizing transposase RayT